MDVDFYFLYSARGVELGRFSSMEEASFYAGLHDYILPHFVG